MQTYKEIKIGNDPWSLKFIESIKNSPHYKTLLLLKQNLEIKLEETPYYEFLKTEGINWIGVNNFEKIIKNYDDMQKQYEKFKNLLKIAPNWKEDNNIIQIINPTGTYYFGKYPVSIDENGEFCLLDGHHRIAILVFLNLPIKVTICKRDFNWRLLLKDLESIYPNKFLYQPIPHPDFDDWKISRNNEKEEILKNLLIKYNLTYIIDLGTCHGYTFYELKNIIKKGIGVESDPIRYKIAKILLYYLGFSCFNEDMFTFIKRYHDRVDCILGLAVFHHFFSNHSIGEFEEFLRLISQKTDYLIYELPHQKEEQYLWIPSFINIDLMIEQITKFKKIEQFSLSNGRTLQILKK